MTVSVIATNNLFGHYATLMVDTEYEEDVVAVYPRNFDVYKLEEYIGKDATTIYIIGHTFTKNRIPALEEELTRLDLDGGMPFTEVIHLANYGESIQLDGVTSIVSPDEPVTTMLGEFIKQGTRLNDGKELTVGTRKLMQYLGEYKDYSFKHHPTSAPLSLKLLSDLYKGNVKDHVKLGKRDVTFDKTLRDTLYERMEEYLTDKMDKVVVRSVNSYVFCLIYSEQYHNEIAHKLINAYEASGFKDVIVFVGKQTKGDDMFHVRVSNGDKLGADKIAEAVNNGKGNEHAATVFLGKPRDTIVDLAVKNISTIL